MYGNKLSRRIFLRNAAVAFPVGAIVLEGSAQAQEIPHLELDDQVAKSLFYVHDVENIDTTAAGYERYEEGQSCANCIQLQGEDGEEWRPCALFPGKLVAATGWCSVWTKKPGTD